jgi:hypothetical protein
VPGKEAPERASDEHRVDSSLMESLCM